MPISRRKFIGTGTMVVLTAGLPLKAAAEQLQGQSSLVSSAKSSRNIGNSSDLDLQTFRRCLETEFRITADNSSVVPAKLVKVHDLKAEPAKHAGQITSKECFSAVFLAPAAARLRQGTYEVEQSSIGKFSLFIVPGSSSAKGSYYEAAFNRL